MKYLEKHPMIMIVIGVIGISLSAIFVKYSTAPSAVTAAFRLLWTVILMTPVAFGFCLFMKGRLSWKAILAICITFLGSLLIALADSVTGGLHLYGDSLALLAAIAVAAYTLIGRVVREKISTMVYTYTLYVVCAIVLVLTCAIQDYSLFDYGMSAVFVGLLLSIFSTILGHSIFSWCLKYFSPAFVSASKLCEPVVAAIFAVFLFQEIPTLLQGIGSVMILGGVYYYSRIEMKTK